MNHSFTKNEKLYYIDIKDGIIHEGRFIESNGDGIWIRLKGFSLNTYVYYDLIDEEIFKNMEQAEKGLENIKNKMRARLSRDDAFIKDILVRLGKNEGNLYLSVIGEILYEKTGLTK